MVDRTGKEVTTAVTNLDIHDIARSCRTYGVTRYFIVNPEPEQERLVETILGHWKEDVSRVHHPSRASALEIVSFVRTFEEAYNEASAGSGVSSESVALPFVVMPDARDLSQYGEAWSYEELRARWEGNRITRPLMIVFGTGWGISPKFFGQVDQLLKPIRRVGLKGNERGYNHLSVRAAAAIVLDRLFGDR
jgi:hypothetical protein